MRTTKRPRVTASHLRSVLSYDKETGVFAWKVDAGRRRRGDHAGCIESRGYVNIGIDGVIYRGHQLAWLYVTGEWPRETVDHKNRNRSDNRWENLRGASMLQQSWNRGESVGVSTRGGRWIARITAGGKQIWLGSHDNETDARNAYSVAKSKLHFLERAA